MSQYLECDTELNQEEGNQGQGLDAVDMPAVISDGSREEKSKVVQWDNSIRMIFFFFVIYKLDPLQLQ